MKKSKICKLCLLTAAVSALLVGCEQKANMSCDSPIAVAEVSAKLAQKLDTTEATVASHTIVLDKKGIREVFKSDNYTECEVKAVMIKSTATKSEVGDYPYLVGYKIEKDEKGKISVLAWLK